MSFAEMFALSDKAYDRLKYMVQIILPAVTTFIGVLGLSLNWVNTDLIVTIMVASTTLLGAILGISIYQYHKVD